MSPADYATLHPWHRKHHERCDQCGDYFDCRDLSDVLFHRTHTHQPDVQTGRGINQVRLCAIQNWFITRMANKPGSYDQAYQQWAASLSEHEQAIAKSFLEDCLLLDREPPQTVLDLITHP